jgi:hypothetical protein
MLRWNEWFIPSRSENSSSCVETLFTSETVYVRNSDRPDGPTVAFTHQEWRAFIAGVRESDEYTLPE